MLMSRSSDCHVRFRFPVSVATHLNLRPFRFLLCPCPLLSCVAVPVVVWFICLPVHIHLGSGMSVRQRYQRGGYRSLGLWKFGPGA